MNENQNKIDHSVFLQAHVVAAFERHKKLSNPSQCVGCKALVHLVANHEEKQWQCPLCGNALPYVFWKVATYTGDESKITSKELIIRLAQDYCPLCGETMSNGRCRCQRKRAAQISVEVQELYAGMDSTKPDDHARRWRRMTELNAELAQLPAEHK